MNPENGEESSGLTRRQAIVGGATVAGIVSMTLPSMASAASEASPTTTTVAPYSESGSADPSLAAINAVPVVTTNGNVEVSGSDSF